MSELCEMELNSMDEASSITPMMPPKSTAPENKSHTCTTRELMRDVVNAGLHVFHIVCFLSLLLRDQDGQTNRPIKATREVGAQNMPFGGQTMDQGKFLKGLCIHPTY